MQVKQFTLGHLLRRIFIKRWLKSLFIKVHYFKISCYNDSVYLKQVNGIIIAQLQQETDSLADADKSVIDVIAFQCPFTGGYAVYQARAIREAYAGATFYDDEQLCFSNQRETHESEPSNIKIQVYPNPAADVAFILLSGVIEEKEIVKVIDIYGALRWQYYLRADENLVQCKLSNLPSGIYCVEYLLSDGSKVCSSKFTISK